MHPDRVPLTEGNDLKLLASGLGPARVLGLKSGQLTRGVAADVSLVDPDVVWRVDPATFKSRSRNTPFSGMELRGRALGVCIGGRLVGDFEDRLRR